MTGETGGRGEGAVFPCLGSMVALHSCFFVHYCYRVLTLYPLSCFPAILYRAMLATSAHQS